MAWGGWIKLLGDIITVILPSLNMAEDITTGVGTTLLVPPSECRT